ncbi:MAG: ArsI/CadI family heavy metal resistance metalloenzyme [Cyclobacteriaceae bacterium]
MNDQLKFHLSLFVSDIDETVSFYQTLFGVEPVKVKEDYAKFETENPGLVISFIQSPEKVRADFGHLGFRVESKEMLATKKQELEEKIAIALEEENTACCYAFQDKFWVSDPDGYEWEVYHFIEDVQQLAKKQSAVSCC